MSYVVLVIHKYSKLVNHQQEIIWKSNIGNYWELNGINEIQLKATYSVVFIFSL